MKKIISNTLIEISNDGLSAYMTLLDSIKDVDDVEKVIDETIEELKEILKVGFDINKVRKVFNDKAINVKTLIAEGIPPIDGKDGYVKYFFDTEKKRSPKILENGTVDYRELDIINNVTAGQILAEVVYPAEGKTGKKVTGEKIPYKKGKNPKIEYGKNVRLLDNNKFLIAEKNGLVTFINGKMVVLDVYKVDNVDNTVGNIYFDGTVIVKGNVLNGFKIKAAGDVQVNGVIEGGYVENSGDVIVKQGIQGYNKHVIKSDGNIFSKFIENAIITSEKNINADAIIYSVVSCKGSIEVKGKRGLILGGVIRAGKEITAVTVGSIMCTSTVLEIGISSDIMKKYESIKNEIDKINEELEKITNTTRIFNRSNNLNKLDYNKLNILGKLIRTQNILENKLVKLHNEYELLKLQVENIDNGFVKISNTIYPGVKIIIGKSSLTIREEMKRCIFYLNEGEIKTRSYWE